MFLIFIILSAVPPPVASNPCWWGDQAIAFTAALWSQNLFIACPFWFHTITLLSLPPDAKYWSSFDHFSPHIYWLCYASFCTKLFGDLRSLCKIVLSREPVESNFLLHAMVPTLISCPYSFLVCFCSATSQINTSPLLQPMASEGLVLDQQTEVMLSLFI